MKTIITLFALSLAVNTTFAQKDCTQDSTGLVPIPQLGADYYSGYQGGLYPGGANARPAAHRDAAYAQVALIKPRAVDGSIDHAAGKVVMIGVGASNPRTEFDAFMQICDTFAQIDPQLKRINTCIGGQSIQKMNMITDPYWVHAMNELEDSGLSAQQVQIAWIETEHTGDANTAFPSAPLALVDEFETLLTTMREIFPNLQICYISARAYSGYATPGDMGPGLLAPRDYYNGWAVKWLIENQINDAPGYEFAAEDDPMPFITWGSYHWSDGSVARPDGFALDCATDVGADGLHLSPAGEEKIGNLMFRYFRQDQTAKKWFKAP